MGAVGQLFLSGVGTVGQARQLARAEDEAGVRQRGDVVRVWRWGAVEVDVGGIHISISKLCEIRPEVQ